jgi:[glutamine synthetase] adenylyltransferase / [glutamine synthetase]-adenylyl-L-tyrosine phosphorylase
MMRALAERLAMPLQPHSAVEPRALELAADLLATAQADAMLAPLAQLLATSPVRQLLLHVVHGSPYLQGLILRDPARFQRILLQAPEQSIADATTELNRDLIEATELAAAMRALRRFKADLALTTALADLGHVYDVMTVTAVLTESADTAVHAALQFLFRAATQRGEWLPQWPENPVANSGYIVLGMGKHGAHELNYSSDIDLIVFYDPSLARLRDGLEASPFFVKLTRDLVRLLSERTADGYVFRTDLRLRPDAGATQIALTTNAAFHYYETVGQNWERAAFIKARAVAGDVPAGVAFLGELAPFIWRKYLDFAAIADIHAMKRQINSHRGFGAVAIPGHNVKLGYGGIREIEFFVQTQQLIAGGRHRDLRHPQTLVALQRLAARDWITPAVAEALDQAYRFLRTLEHRVQMVADEQTHSLPTNPEELERLAQFAGFADTAALTSHLLAVLDLVQRHYARLFETSPQLTAGTANMVFAGATDDPATLEALAGMGYTQPAQVIATVRGWHHGRYRAVRSPNARERLTEVQPLLIEALGQTADPDAALANFDRFLVDLPTSIQLFALLRTKPGLLQLLADIMGSAPRLAGILSRRRRLFDAVLDSGAFATLPTAHDYQLIIADALPPPSADGNDFEAVLNAVRVIGSEQSFLIGVRTLAGAITPKDASAAYSSLADSLIVALHTRIEHELARTHGVIPGCGAVIVALGKLGGREMTPTSDLDLIVVYEMPEATADVVLQSNGSKPLPPSLYYARFAQRLVAALSVPTAEGTLYDVDLRLRPSGQKGPLATSLSSFVTYQRSEAWTWEHMALTRARVVSGPPALRSAVEAAIRKCLIAPRDPLKLATDIVDMRARIATEKGTTDIWDLKQVRGGQVDVEFIVQYLQLRHAHTHPAILETNVLEALSQLAAHNLISPADHDALARAANLYAQLTGMLRLMLVGPFSSKTASADLKDQLVRCANAPSFSGLEADLIENLNTVYEIHQRLLPTPVT